MAIMITREMIADNLVSVAELEADPLWEKDFITGIWFRRTPEFFAARERSERLIANEAHDATLALANALAILGRELPPQKDGKPGPATSNGTNYVEVTSKQSPELSHEWLPIHETYKAAIDVWRLRLREYAAAVAGDTLLWRERPEIQGLVPFGQREPNWRVYSRLAIE